jgi:hypothetical protein
MLEINKLRFFLRWRGRCDLMVFPLQIHQGVAALRSPKRRYYFFLKVAEFT